ncbi:MAG: cytosine/creatinine deaminase [Actinomycetota bacterium]|nr:cytosine/creatinine deaminase [Actinomycetota bacterium]
MGLLLRAATLAGGSTCAGVRLSGPVTADVRVDGDRLAWIDPPGTLAPAPGDIEFDLSGYLLIPAPAEPHAHLDLALLGDRVPNPTGDLAGALAAVRSVSLDRRDILDRARRAVRAYLAHGVTAIRTHVEVGGRDGLHRLEALLALRAELRGTMTIQLVALTAPGSRPAVLREALALGADLVGGAPDLEPDPARAIADRLDIAGEAGVGVDLHVDGVPGPAEDGLTALVRAVRSTGFDRPVTAGHVLDLGRRSPAGLARIAEEVAAAGIGVVTLPQSDLFPPGRPDAVQGGSAGHGYPVVLRALLEAGVTVAAGGGNLRDVFNPMGRGDPLEIASLLVVAGRFTPEEAYTAVSGAARTVMGLPAVPSDGVLTDDVPAELLAVRASRLGEAIASGDPDRTVITGGKISVRTRLARTYPMPLS